MRISIVNAMHKSHPKAFLLMPVFLPVSKLACPGTISDSLVPRTVLAAWRSACFAHTGFQALVLVYCM